MSEGLEKLRSIGAQRIHEQTHIAHKYVQSLLHESFEGMQKVQLLGFISIMEREYGVDLTPLRESAIEYFEVVQEPSIEEGPSYKKELLVSSKNDNKKLYILLGIIAVIVVAAILYLNSQEQEETSTQKIKSETAVVSEPKEQVSAPLENNETNATSSAVDENASKPEVVQQHSLSIIPRTKVWVGIIDLDTGKKRQKVISEPLELNASKNYLLTFGHGYIDMEVDGNKTTFKDPQSIKFLYKDGTLKKIGITEFKEYNKGKLW